MNSPDNQLTASMEGLTVLVTGANRGLGAAYVAAALERGAARVYAAVRDPASMSELATVQEGRVVPVPFDLTDPGAAPRLAQQCPGTHLVVCNAGGVLFGPPLGADLAEVREHFEVNFFGQFALISAFAPLLEGPPGGFVVVTSAAAQILSRSAGVYSASKSALAMLGYAVGAQLAPQGMTVSVVYPGYVATDMVEDRDMPKASPLSVAHRTYDDWLAGKASIFPDRHAQIVEETLATRMAAVLANPLAVAHEVSERFTADTAAGQ